MDQIDQTGFAENQEILQTPPLPENHQTTEPSRLASKTKKKQKILLISVGVTVFLLLLVAMISLTPRNGVDQSNQNLNFQNPNQQTTSAFSQRLQDLKNQLDTSDPTDVELAPPPVNYQLQFLSKNNY